MTRNAIKMLYCGQQNFMFAIRYSSKPSPAFLYCNHRPNAFMEKKTEQLWQGTCNKNTYSGSRNRIRFYICDSRPAADREFPGRKQREQELRDWALLAEWLDGKREENDDVITVHNGKMTYKRKPQWNQAGQKYNSASRHNTGKATSPKYSPKAEEFTSGHFLTLSFYQFTLVFEMNAFYNSLWTDLSSLNRLVNPPREDLGGNRDEPYSPSSQSLEPPPCGWQDHVLWFLSKIPLRRGPTIQLAFPLLRDCGSLPEARLSPRNTWRGLETSWRWGCCYDPLNK